MIKNYTSSVSAGKSISHIEDCLSRNGATSIIKEYSKERELIAISFCIQIKERLVPFKLPARVEQVEKVLKQTVSRPHKGTFDRIREQAIKTAWKIISDWIDAQVALVELEQAELMEIFLPYMWIEKQGKSFYQIAVSSGFLLEAPKKTS